jgi:hypothetical protein
MENENLDNITSIFKLPIFYNSKVKKLNENIPLELELYKNIDNSNNDINLKPIYYYIFSPKLTISNKIMEDLSSHFTTDVKFLKNTQKLLKNIKINDINTISNKHNFFTHNIENSIKLWKEIKNESGFCEKYLYIDWNFAKQLNNNPSFLQIMSLYNISSPLLSLCLPIFILILPFFMIKLKGMELNIKDYLDILKSILSQQAIVKIFTNFNNVNINQKIYLLISAAFYIFSIYQNILICIRFYSNMKKIHDYLFNIKSYLAFSIDLMKYHLEKSNKLTKYTDFNNELTKHIDILETLLIKLNSITEFKLSFFKMLQIGNIMHIFYQLYEDPLYNNSFIYSFGFHAYFDLLYGIKTNIDNKVLNKTNYSKKPIKPIFKKLYYPKFMYSKNNVMNDCNLKQNIIITGPNASGKTTYIKSVLINILLSQQIGYGCFNKAKLSIFEHIYCYLNIPDTSGRDSLFQAEARRCKDILDSISKYSNQTHFCIFDELYSGTNPEEAVLSASAFINYIIKNNNISCLLTTHYLQLCENLKSNHNVKNYNMLTIHDNDDFKYTYLLQEGISNIKGGLKVLKDMNYPNEILDKTFYINNSFSYNYKYIN